MDIERAIEILKIQKSFIADINIDALVAYDMAIKALKKQVNQKGIPYNSAKCHKFVECPECNKDMDKYYNHCHHCGQKVDWA